MTGKYQRYPDYKDSGAEWLGGIPRHWDVKRHKHFAKYIKGRNPSILQDNPFEGSLPYLSMDSLRGKSISKYAAYESNLYITQSKQPLIIWDGSNAGEYIQGNYGILSSTMAAAEVSEQIHESFYWYQCKAIENEIRKSANGMGIPHVDNNELKNISLPTPDLTEQVVIANFLDHETAKIDALIEKQEKLIELLKEKRQAVIS